MKKFHIGVISSLLIAVIAFGGFTFTANSANEPQEVQILFSHDMHSYFEPTYRIENGTKSEQGGFARIKTVIDNKRRENPDYLVVDAGDFSMGTLYQTIYDKAASELRMLGKMGYDVTTFGNHEFDYRGKGVADMLYSAMDSKDKLPSIVASNIDWKASTDLIDKEVKKAMDSYGVKEYEIIQKGNTKIAIFGLLGKDADSCAPLSGLEFSDPIETAKEIVKTIKETENPDMVICLSHSGTWEDKKKSEDELLAKQVPEIDVIISGHTHSSLPEPIIVGNTVIASMGEYGRRLGDMTLTKAEDGQWNLKSYDLISIDDSIEQDPEILEDIKGYKEDVKKLYLSKFGYEYDQVLAYSPFDFTDFEMFSKEQREDSLGNIIADSYIYAVKEAEGDNYEKVDVSIVPSGVIRDSIRKGNVTVSDVFNISSLGIGEDGIPGYPLVKVYLTGKELKTACEVDASISPMMTTAQLYMNGISFTFNPKRLILNKVTDAKLEVSPGQYEEIQDGKLYSVVAGLYSAQMLSAVEKKSLGILSIVPKDKNGNPITDFKDSIVTNANGEVKEWVALASYLESFDKENGVSAIPEYYNTTHDRKIVHSSTNLIELLKKPNKIFFILVAVIVFVIAIVVLVVIFAIRTIRKYTKQGEDEIIKKRRTKNK